ncbi:MAG TPA: hypothetical protein PLW86_14455, partial [Rhodocyclaceae bacterium]|nr:hypothetical protein [Rhodocyclaceae bacterium]
QLSYAPNKRSAHYIDPTVFCNHKRNSRPLALSKLAVFEFRYNPPTIQTGSTASWVFSPTRKF